MVCRTMETSFLVLVPQLPLRNYICNKKPFYCFSGAAMNLNSPLSPRFFSIWIFLSSKWMLEIMQRMVQKFTINLEYY